MSYQINKTNGDLLVDLIDGQIDTISTDITLVGRNYKGFGEFLNENYIKILENFANSGAPSTPLTGQLWYDTAEERLKIYNGTTFKSAGGPIVSNTQPQMVAGDLWIDNGNNKLYFFDGADLVLVGPEYSAGQGQTGFVTETVVDTTNQERVVLLLYIGGTLSGVLSNSQFRLDGIAGGAGSVNFIAGYPRDENDTANPKRQLINVGFNLASTNFLYNGTATSASALVDTAGNRKVAENFMITDGDTSTTGKIRVRNSNGLSIGISDTEYLLQRIVGDTVILDNIRADVDFTIRVREGNATRYPLFVDASEARFGIWNQSPIEDFQVGSRTSGNEKNALFTGDVTIDGNLLVSGDTSYLNVSTLRVQDKNVVLGLLDDSTEGNDSQVDDAGIRVASTDGSKDFTWKDASDSWTSNKSIDLYAGQTYKINNNTVLSGTSLGSGISSAPGLTSIGTLGLLNVNNITLGSSSGTISASGSNLILDSDNNISMNNNVVNDVATPVSGTDASNKTYVDTEIKKKPLAFPLDTTGLTNPFTGLTGDGPYNDVKAILTIMYPPAGLDALTTATVFCSGYTNTTVSGITIDVRETTDPDSGEVLVLSRTDVASPQTSGDANVTSTESVVQDVQAGNTASGNVNLTPQRAYMEFEINSGAWSWIRTTVYS